MSVKKEKEEAKSEGPATNAGLHDFYKRDE